MFEILNLNTTVRNRMAGCSFVHWHTRVFNHSRPTCSFADTQDECWRNISTSLRFPHLLTLAYSHHPLVHAALLTPPHRTLSSPPQFFRLYPEMILIFKPLSLTASSWRQWAIAPRARTDPLVNGMSPASPTWVIRSIGRITSTRTCPSGTCQASPTWTRCSLWQVPSIRTCPSGTCRVLPICGRCSMRRWCSTRTCPSGTFPVSPTWGRCSLLQVYSTRACPSGMCLTSAPWWICSLVRGHSTRTCPSGMCPASPTCRRYSIKRGHSTRTCPSGMCLVSPTWHRCSLSRVRSSKSYVARRGSDLRQRKLICSTARPARYRPECVVCVPLLALS